MIVEGGRSKWDVPYVVVDGEKHGTAWRRGPAARIISAVNAIQLWARVWCNT